MTKMVDAQDAPRPRGEMFEIQVNGVSRTMRDVRSAAIAAALALAARERGATVKIVDQRDNSEVVF
jgi:hypothetical protein